MLRRRFLFSLTSMMPVTGRLLVVFISACTCWTSVSAQIAGCEYPGACNYNPEASVGDGSCIFPEPFYDCAGNCLLDLNNNGLCDLEEVAGCTSIDAINYNPEATLDDGSCIITCKGDFNSDGVINTNDLLFFLSAYGNPCNGAGCMDPAGCNYDPGATFDLGYCEYPVVFFTCEGLPINDADGDGVPDEMEVAGCTDPLAHNYNLLATDDDGSCEYFVQGGSHSCGVENVHNPNLLYSTISDIDGNTYRTIGIGNQEWMAEDLKTSRYSNGDIIPNITNNAQWAAQTQGAWCYYDNDAQFACPNGKLYNWYVTIDERNVCPTGWHVPSDAEWTVLTDYLAGLNAAGGKMKSLTGWWSPNVAATNESGFSGLANGARYDAALGSGFLNYGSHGLWWSTTEDLSNGNVGAWFRQLRRDVGSVDRNNYYRECGFSIRCLRD